MTTEARIILMDLAEKVSAMRDEAYRDWGGHEIGNGKLSAFDFVLETIVAELDRK